jgi:hypothetical protein
MDEHGVEMNWQTTKPSPSPEQNTGSKQGLVYKGSMLACSCSWSLSELDSLTGGNVLTWIAASTVRLFKREKDAPFTRR